MTAHDDVRARFEAWALRKALPVEKELSKERLVYESYVTGFAWLAWKDAHADLSGEVRELVEADREYDAAMHSEADTDGVLRRETARERRKAALAKFTYQRATNYVSGYVDDAGKFHPTHQEKP